MERMEGNGSRSSYAKCPAPYIEKCPAKLSWTTRTSPTLIIHSAQTMTESLDIVQSSLMLSLKMTGTGYDIISSNTILIMLPPETIRPRHQCSHLRSLNLKDAAPVPSPATASFPLPNLA
jgi:hypothetical protein